MSKHNWNLHTRDHAAGKAAQTSYTDVHMATHRLQEESSKGKDAWLTYHGETTRPEGKEEGTRKYVIVWRSHPCRTSVDQFLVNVYANGSTRDTSPTLERAAVYSLEDAVRQAYLLSTLDRFHLTADVVEVIEEVKPVRSLGERI